MSQRVEGPVMLVTGGAGFIGSNFILLMLAAREDVRIVNVDLLTYAGNLSNLDSVVDDPRHVFVQADIADKGAMEAVFKRYDPDVVVNFAAESHVDRSIADPDPFVRANVVGTVNLLERAHEAWSMEDGYRKGAKFVQVSTDEVYGSLSLDGAEPAFTEERPLSPRSPYSASKASADLFVASFRDTYGLPVNIVRCSNNFGPRQHSEKFVPKVISCVAGRRAVPVYGDGLNVRDWVYVEDCCRAISLIVEQGRLGETYNVGARNERSNNDVVRSVAQEVGRAIGDSGVSKELIEYVADRKGHDRRYAMDASKLQRELGWHPEVGFEEGVAATVAWYLRRPERLS